MPNLSEQNTLDYVLFVHREEILRTFFMRCMEEGKYSARGIDFSVCADKSEAFSKFQALIETSVRRILILLDGGETQESSEIFIAFAQKVRALAKETRKDVFLVLRSMRSELLYQAEETNSFDETREESFSRELLRELIRNYLPSDS